MKRIHDLYLKNMKKSFSLKITIIFFHHGLKSATQIIAKITHTLRKVLNYGLSYAGLNWIFHA